jgi:hypothetical protein
MKTKLDRESYIALYLPKDAVRVTSKRADAVAYIWADAQNGIPRGALFIGKQAEPVWRYRFRNTAEREKHITETFAEIKASQDRKAADQAERKAWVHDYKVGDILNTCWGYDQTNREFFEVIEVKGKHLILREIAQVREYHGDMNGVTSPQVGKYISEPIRRLAGRYGVKIDDVRHARRWSSRTVGDIQVVGPKLNFSEWA